MQDKIDLMLVANTPETTNPVCTQCEIEEVACVSTDGAVAALVHRPAGQPGRRPAGLEAVQLRLSLLLGPRGRDRGLHQHVGPAADQQDGRRAVPQRRRRQCLGRQAGRLPAGARQAGLQARSIRAATRTSPTISRPRSPPSRAPMRRSSPAWCCRPTSPPSGNRRCSRASSPRLPRSARRSCSRSRSRRSAATATTSPRKSGGRRAIRSSRR